MFENINEIAVLVSAILAVAVGSIWYSPLLFGKMWMNSIGFHAEDDYMTSRAMFFSVVRGIIVQCIFFFCVAQFTTYTINAVISITKIGVILSILFGAQIFSMSIWEKRSFSYALINTGYLVIILFGGLGVITYWPW